MLDRLKGRQIISSGMSFRIINVFTRNIFRLIRFIVRVSEGVIMGEGLSHCKIHEHDVPALTLFSLTHQVQRIIYKHLCT